VLGLFLTLTHLLNQSIYNNVITLVVSLGAISHLFDLLIQLVYHLSLTVMMIPNTGDSTKDPSTHQTKKGHLHPRRLQGHKPRNKLQKTQVSVPYLWS